ncbi:alpha/beta fold hydrolase [Marivirga sp. S37H4]|uniref:Alpha/beta fold hydrolase n=1 Tax=Marivirga aurantiaca TaxID=2802615 RepID=A0A934WUV6_9BACT|nr:alpha/beta fold hydrolase [Marivirga aurantiaca]MBK6263423.1 alpha/beta fold hydrolase [Marivirga aurantiaca]
MKTLYLLLITLILSNFCFAQDFTGKWNGILDAQGTQIPLIFTIEKTDNGYHGSFDSPKQGVKDISFTSVTVEDKSIRLDATNIGAFYKGELIADSVVGTWNQGGASLPLNLSRKELKESKPNRPQEPQGLLPYKSEEVKFYNNIDEITLAGTLTLPENAEKKHPVVILISGSGPQNRDEEVFGHKTFLVLADHLTRKGIAVLRYDDRGTAESEGDFSNATTADFATDVLSAVEFLKSRKDINIKQIGLIGHSEGGIIAPMVANQSEDISYLISLAGTGISGKELSLMQSRSLNTMEGNDKEAFYLFNKKLLEIATSDESTEEKRKKMMSHFENSKEMIKKSLPEGTNVDNFISQQISSALSPWAQYFFQYNPSKEFEKIKIPVLSLNGNKDVQVDATVNQNAIREALKKAGNKQSTIKELDGLNHLFQEAETGAISEYGLIEQTFSPVALNEISEWILKINQK